MQHCDLQNTRYCTRCDAHTDDDVGALRKEYMEKLVDKLRGLHKAFVDAHTKPSEGNRRDAIASWLGDDVRGLLDHFDDMVRMFRGLDLYSARETCDLVVDRLADAYKERVQPDYESLASIVWDVLIDVVDAVEFEKVKDEDRWSA